jgi:hypothetical protein
MAPPADAELRLALTTYSTALKLRAAAFKSSADLVSLDHWYRTELGEVIERRRAANDAGTSYLTVEELGKLMQWKLAVGLLLRFSISKPS